MNHETEHERIDRLERTIYGDENNMGMDEKLNEIYEVFHGTKMTAKAILYIVISIGAVSLAILNLGKVWALIVAYFKQ